MIGKRPEKFYWFSQWQELKHIGLVSEAAFASGFGGYADFGSAILSLYVSLWDFTRFWVVQNRFAAAVCVDFALVIKAR